MAPKAKVDAKVHSKTMWPDDVAALEKMSPADRKGLRELQGLDPKKLKDAYWAEAVNEAAIKKHGKKKVDEFYDSFPQKPTPTPQPVESKDQYARRRQKSDFNIYKLYQAYRDGTGYLRITGTGPKSRHEWTAEDVQRAFSSDSPQGERRLEHFKRWKAGEVEIGGFTFDDEWTGEGPGPDPTQPTWTEREESDPVTSPTRPPQHLDEQWEGPSWKVGIFGSIAHGTGWIDVTGAVGPKGKYYNHFQVRQMWEDNPDWQTDRDAWRTANGFVPGEGWTEGPPAAGTGSISQIFDLWYQAKAENGGKPLDDDFDMGNGMTAGEVREIVSSRPSIQREHDRWLEKHDWAGGEPLGEPDTNREEEPEYTGPTHLRPSAREDLTGLAQRLISEHDAAMKEGEDVHDLVRLTQNFEKRMAILERRGTIDWDNITWDSSRFHNPEAEDMDFRERISSGQRAGWERKGRRYNPWIWAQGELEEFGSLGPARREEAIRGLKRGERYLGSRPEPQPEEPTEEEMRPIPDRTWELWIKDAERRNLTPGIIRQEAYAHFQPEFTTEEIDKMLGVYFGEDVDPPVARNQAQTTPTTDEKTADNRFILPEGDAQFQKGPMNDWTAIADMGSPAKPRRQDRSQADWMLGQEPEYRPEAEMEGPRSVSPSVDYILPSGAPRMIRPGGRADYDPNA